MRAAHILLFALPLLIGATLQSRTKLPVGWEAVNRATPNSLVTFSLVLKQCNLEKLESILLSVSTPGSSEYGQYLSAQEVKEIVECPGKDQVLNWIHKHPVLVVKEQSSQIKVTMRVNDAEAMLGCELHVVAHQKSGKTFIRHMGEISLPDFIEDSVAFVSGISEYFVDTKFKAESYSPALDYDPNTLINISLPMSTPNVLRTLYNVDPQHASYGSQVGIAAFDNMFDEGAFCSFNTIFRYLQDPDVLFPESPVGSDQVESDLDVQYSSAMANGASVYFYNEPNNNWILDWATATLENSRNGPYVWSISYGFPEIWQCLVLNGTEIFNCPTNYNFQDYMVATDAELMKLGAMGISILVSSGDDGSPGFASNFPIDTTQPIAPSGVTCAQVSSSICNCGQLMVQANGDFCIYPNGLLVDIIGCATIEQYVYLPEALNLYFNQTFTNPNDGSVCNISASFDPDQESFYFYSDCVCSAFTDIEWIDATGVQWTISGFQLDLNNGPSFFPDYPTSSPYVTSVGATSLPIQDQKCTKDWLRGPEYYSDNYGAGQFSGGGGFSTVHPMPLYQTQAVNYYLNSQNPDSLPPSNLWDSRNRAYPDVSFNGANYLVWLGLSAVEEGDWAPAFGGANGILDGVSGTSASSPALAGLITLLNAQLEASGKPRLGFLNPILYKMAAEVPETFYDIVPGTIYINGQTYDVGVNTACNRAACSLYGFPIAEGWDAGTGLGTPNYQEIFNYLLQ